jgi:hypothetical protein
MNTEAQWDEFCSSTRRQKPVVIERKSVSVPMIGKTFGYLIVLDRDGKYADGHAKFLCRCACGDEVSVGASALRRGVTKSCGCMKGFLIREDKRMKGFLIRDKRVA